MMRIGLRIDRADGRHVYFTVFMGTNPGAVGANCGKLCMLTEEFDVFILALGTSKDLQLDVKGTELLP